MKPRRCANREHWTPDRSLAAIPRDAFDYVWLVDVPAYDPRSVADMQLLWRGPGSLLYAIRRTGDQPQP